MTDNRSIAGEAAGVPFLAVPPASGSTKSTPTVVVWHMMDAPRTEAAFAAALPLEGLDVWRIYLGLPMCGSRLPQGGFEELVRLATEDAVLNLHGPVVAQAVGEFPTALEDLRGRLGLGQGRIGVVGASIGAAIALGVLTESGMAVDAAVLISPVIRLRAMVEAMSRFYGITYPWSDPSRKIADRLDFVARADEIASAGEPAVLLVVGEEDDVEGFRRPAEALRDALTGRYAEARRAETILVPGMAHALAEEPGMEPAQQTQHAAEVDRLAVQWLRRHLARHGAEASG